MGEKEVVIITGGSGFIGSALINKLAGHFTLVGLDKIPARQPPPAAECVCIDLTSEEGMRGAFARINTAYGKSIASVVHLAAYFDLTGEPSELYEQITVRGTERLLKHLRTLRSNNSSFLRACSCMRRQSRERRSTKTHL